MRTTVDVLLCFVVVLAWCLATASEDGRTRHYPEYRCRLTLPGPDYQWLDHTQIASCAAFLGDATGTIRFLMSVQENEEDAVINEQFVKAFDHGFTESGAASKISGRIGQFRGVPCYQMHARLEGIGSPVTIRVFAANGYILQLQLLGSDLPIDERGKLEPIFSAFEFVGEPELPEPKADQRAKEIAKSTAKYKYIALISAGALAVIILVIRDAARRRKKRRSSGQ